MVPIGFIAAVDDDDVVELLGQVLGGAHEVDHLADRPEGRRLDQVALHQSAGRVFRIGQRLGDGEPLAGIERGQHLAALFLLEVLDQVDDVVGLELARRLGDLGGLRMRSTSSRTPSSSSASTSGSMSDQASSISARRSSWSICSRRSAMSATCSSPISATTRVAVAGAHRLAHGADDAPGRARIRPRAPRAPARGSSRTWRRLAARGVADSAAGRGCLSARRRLREIIPALRRA